MSQWADDKEKQMLQLSSLIGNTPLLEIEFTFRGDRRVLYAKAENLNMTGSIKDRMAFHILRKAYERGTLTPDVDLAGFRGYKRTCETCCIPSECEPGIRPLERMALPPCPRRAPGC